VAAPVAGEQFCGGAGILQRAVVLGQYYAGCMAAGGQCPRGQVTQVMARESHGAHDRSRRQLQAAPAELFCQEHRVEPRVMRDEDPAGQLMTDRCCGRSERRRAAHVRCLDPVDTSGPNVPARVDERAEFASDLCVGIHVHHGDLDHPVPRREQPGRFHVHYGEPRDNSVHGERREPAACLHYSSSREPATGC
jgi:hypothetical protein